MKSRVQGPQRVTTTHYLETCFNAQTNTRFSKGGDALSTTSKWFMPADMGCTAIVLNSSFLWGKVLVLTISFNHVPRIAVESGTVTTISPLELSCTCNLPPAPPHYRHDLRLTFSVPAMIVQWRRNVLHAVVWADFWPESLQINCRQDCWAISRI
jgi:hypothetical protein